MDQEFTWKIFDKYFKDNPTSFIDHHLESYNEFFNNSINKIFNEKNPIKILKNQDEKTKKYKLNAHIFLGGRNGDKLYFGKPIIYDEKREHYMYPNEARLRNMTYGVSIHYDVEIDFLIYNDKDEMQQETLTLEKIFLGRFPIMLGSNLCILNKFNKYARYTMGECRNDKGGYFIIDGKEKAIISQEKFADNMLYIRDKVNELYSHSAEIRTVSEDSSKQIRTLSIRIVSPTSKLSNNNIVVNIPNVRKPIPLFILMRALGIISDKDIIKCCILDLNKYKSLIDLFTPSIYDAGYIFNQNVALKYISTFTKNKTISHVLEILSNYFLPNIGEINFRDKALFIGYMVFELLNVFIGKKKATNRDSFKYKRVELAGDLIYDLFREYYTLQQKNIYEKIDKEYYYKQGLYQDNFISLIENNYKDFFKERIVEDGFKKAFKGNWGAHEHTKKIGVIQDMIRLSFNSYLSIMRKINLPFDSSAKITGPRLLHSSQWGIIDPLDTPDGGNIGLHKHMSIMAKITKKCSAKPLINWLINNTDMLILNECNFDYLSLTTKIFVNGAWIGMINDPDKIHKKLLDYRRNGLIPIYTSITWDIDDNSIILYTDAGRLCYPVYYIDHNSKSLILNNKEIIEKIIKNDFNWIELISGFNKKIKDYNDKECQIYDKINDLYSVSKIDSLREKQAIIEYLDTSEKENALICIDYNNLDNKPYTHLEIDPSIILGVMGNQIILPENNQLPRNLFSCGQSKQAISIYHTNFINRFDKMGVILNYGQIPLLKSRYLKYINNEEHPYGINVIVAISCYTGYNVEDSILFNKGSIERGLFNNIYYNSYETNEESSKIGNNVIDSRFSNIENSNVISLKPGYDYSELDDNGLIKENTLMDDKKILIGKVVNNVSNPNLGVDYSIPPKKGQEGYVDKTFITENEEGFRIAKVRIRDYRFPVLGDKFCSRCGQKGTVGQIIPEENMPYTEDGMRPDIIINPHALPSRMTIGQLVETIMGKACLIQGTYGDCTAFINKGSKLETFGNILSKFNFNRHANEILYNGESGKQMKMDIFIGPTYYMRLKQLVKDKINYRAKGPRTVLTRQTVQGRANDGGLRIGEMERDGIMGHGMSNFLKDSMLLRGDEYYIAICNLSGLIAIYNKELNLFISPFVDGPIKFSGNLDNELNIEKITKFGKDFSIVRVPYAFKLLMQELSAMNIQLRIITDKNIDQINNMSFTKNIIDFNKIDLSDMNENKSVIDSKYNSKTQKKSKKDITQQSKKTQDKLLDTVLEEPLERELEEPLEKELEEPLEKELEEPLEKELEEPLGEGLQKTLKKGFDDTFQSFKKIVIGEDTSFEPDKIKNIEVSSLKKSKNEEKEDDLEADQDSTLDKIKISDDSEELDRNFLIKNPSKDVNVLIVDDPEIKDEEQKINLPILTNIDEPEKDEKDDSIKKTIIVNS